MTFRDRLREQIEFSGLTNREVAEKANITKRAIDSYVGSESCMPSAEIAVKLAKVLGVTVEYLVTGDLKMDDNKAREETTDKNARSLLHFFSTLSIRDQSILVSLAEDMTKI